MARAASTAGRPQVDARAELLSFISHELRTPLTSVIGYSEILLAGETGDLLPEQVAMVQRISANGARLFELIEALLCAAIERNLDGSTVDVADVVLEAMRLACGTEVPGPTA